MALAGDLRQFALTDVLRVIESGQRTGALMVTRNRLRATLYFSGGQWLLAERVGATVTLAQQFARVGLLTPEQFEAALGVPFSQAGAISDAQVARTLLGAGLLTQEQLRTFAVDDATALLSVILAWPDGEFIFEDAMPLPAGRVALPLPVTPLVAQAQRLIRANTHASRDTAPLAPDAVIDFAETDPQSDGAVQVTREQWKLLTAVDGHSTLWEIIQKLQAPEHIILRLAGELVATGVVVIARA